MQNEDFIKIIIRPGFQKKPYQDSKDLVDTTHVFLRRIPIFLVLKENKVEIRNNAIYSVPVNFLMYVKQKMSQFIFIAQTFIYQIL